MQVGTHEAYAMGGGGGGGEHEGRLKGRQQTTKCFTSAWQSNGLYSNV